VGGFNAVVMVDQSRDTGLNRVRNLERVWLDLVADGPGKCGNGIFRLRGNPAQYFKANCLRQPVAVANWFLSDSLTITGYVLGRTANFLASSAELPNRLLGLSNTSSFIDDSPFRELLQGVIDEDRIRKSSKRLQIIATNWITGKSVSFGNADFHDGLGASIVMASSAIPGFSPPVVMGAEVFVDGSAVNNTPLNPAIKVGATELHVIYVDPQTKFIPLQGEANAADSLLRLYYLMVAAKLSEDIETARWINDGIQALSDYQASGRLRAEFARDILRVAKQILSQGKYKKLTIHRYFPRAAMGTQLDLINFGRDRIVQMIGEGERVALVHDCIENGCVPGEK
jgi:predicted acylesterase/phospholipase RssA